MCDRLRTLPVAHGIEVVEPAGADDGIGRGRPVATAVFAGAEEEVILAVM
jgi:hypothetical protein